MNVLNSAWTRAIVAILSVFVILVAIGQVFFAGGAKITTETAYNYGYDVEIPFEGVILRDETVIYSSGSGVLSYEHEDGVKAGKSTVIARRYKSDSDVAYLREIEQLKEQIKMLESAEMLIGTDNSQLEAISAQINESHSQMVSSIIDGNFAAASNERSKLLCAMCKREITLKESGGYAEKKRELQNRISELEVKISGDVQEIQAGGTGYFVSSIDGYEGEFGYSDVDKMTEETISKVVEKPTKAGAKNAIGKLVSDYHWRAAAVIENEKMVGIYEGGKATLRVGSGQRQYETTVVAVNKCGDGKSVYIFEGDNFVSNAVDSRTASFKLVVNSYGGLRVPRKALRYDENEQRGVFVLRGQTLKFKKVDVVYWGEGYVICSQEKDEDYLKLYDKIVVEGKDLYDGKVI